MRSNDLPLNPEAEKSRRHALRRLEPARVADDDHSRPLICGEAAPHGAAANGAHLLGVGGEAGPFKKKEGRQRDEAPGVGGQRKAPERGARLGRTQPPLAKDGRRLERVRGFAIVGERPPVIDFRLSLWL